MSNEELKLKLSVIISATNTSGNQKLDAIMELFNQLHPSPTPDVEFGEWLNKNAYPSYDSNGVPCGWNLHKGMDGNIYTTTELYTHYSKTKNNEQQ